MNTAKLWVLMVLAVGVTVPLTAAEQGKKKPGRSQPVVVAKVARQMMAPTIWVPGTVISRDDAKIAAEVAARLTWVAEIGTRVEKGQPVARLENLQQQLQVAELEAVVARERAKLVFLNQEVKRLTSLAAQNNAAKNRLEQSQADRNVARSELRAAQARVKLAKDRLQRSELLAPFGGIVSERLKNAGEWVDGGAAVVRLIDAQALEIQAHVPISSMSYLHNGDSLRVKDGEKILAFPIRALVPVGDQRSRLLELRLSINQPFAVGQSLRVAVPTAAPRQVLALPRDALVLRSNSTSVFKVNGKGAAEKVAVNLGIAEGALIEVTGNIAAGDQVVVRGNERLRPGQPVKIQGAKP